MKISPSILSGDFAYFAETVKTAEKGGADFIHIDVMDGHFVPNITIGPQTVAAIKKRTKLPLDVHLMISEPDKYIEKFIRAGADILTVHVEASVHIHRSIQLINSFGIKSGISINPSTPVEALEHLLPDVDLVLLMTVNPGFGGQSFIPQMMDKIKKMRMMMDLFQNDILLEVYGGVNKENISKLSALGVDICVAGAAVYGSENVEQAIKDLKNKSSM